MNIHRNKSRLDGAIKVTDCFPTSCQNPVFSPDGKQLLFTRFKNGYNRGPAEIIKIDLATKKEKTIIGLNGDNVNVPFGSWIDNKITFATENGIGVANDDGSNFQEQLNNVYLRGVPNIDYIEPVFNPTNTNQIALEAIKNDIHQIKLLVLGKSGNLINLTDGTFDDRLPSWSPDGKKVLWQRSELGKDHWQIMVADVTVTDSIHLENITTLTEGPDDTDNSWLWDGKHVLSSRTGDGKIPNIFSLNINNQKFTRVTNSLYEDGAPTSSPRGDYIAFESHIQKDESSPTEIWMIKNP